MTENSIFCADCGSKNEQSSIFCENCGKELKAAKPGKYSKLGGYQTQESFSPTMMAGPSTWNQGSLINATINSYVKPDNTIPPLLEDLNSPNTTPLVLVYAFLSAVLTYMLTSKVTYTFQEGINEEITTAFQPEVLSILASISAIGSFLGVFLVWYIGSWILASIIKSGLPMNSPILMNASHAMRKLNAIRYVPSIIIVTIQIILLQFEDNQELYLSEAVVGGQDTVITKIITNFSPLYMMLSFILVVIALLASLYVLYKGVKAIGYQGGTLMMITVGLGLWGFYSAYATYINV